ncbi:AraC family transcriptional regulator [Flexivirga sp. ID2601S]|uniref:AraC family transcriptional regulator n=1 Tax=Flexivirga aerilata TaxID=1656889 RepID=A0A849AE32_9MICO|nr:AraC family transcriptional regulator [Flexivirga aerilata]NNG38043.1 AraC family transcriptional regulator [Flexivirga aerilata]
MAPQPGTLEPSPTAPEIFRTADLPAPDRVRGWELHNAEALIGLACRQLDGPALDATEQVVVAADLHLARVTANGHFTERDARMVRRTPQEATVVFCAIAGESVYYSDGAMRSLRPGELLVVDADRPCVRGFSAGFEEIVLTVPRAVGDSIALHRTADQARVLPFRGRSATPWATTLVGRLRASFSDHGVADGLLDLLAGATTPGAQSASSDSHFAAAASYVEARVGDPALSATRIAAAVGLSPRQLSRVFAARDLTVPGYVTSRRLQRAHRLLAAGSERPVTEIAHTVGFASPSRFAAAFRELYGESPSAFRARVRAERSA